MNPDLLINIIKELKDFETENKRQCVNIEDFRNYLNEKAYHNDSPSSLQKKYDLEVNKIDNEIAKQIILVYRYSKLILKKAMENYPSLINEDFTYLYRLMDYEYLTKSQLIEKNAHEKQTGTEIIKRLVKFGLISEEHDPKDKRSIRISVTEEGKKIFMESMEEVTKVAKIMSGPLKIEEKEKLLEYLKKLNLFHQTIYKNHRLENLHQLTLILP